MVRTLRFHMQGALVRDLGSHRPSGAAKKKKKKSQVETLFPHVMVLGGRAFGRWLGHEGGALMNEINTA